MGEPQPPATKRSWNDGPSSGRSKAHEAGNRIQESPSRLDLALGVREGLCLPTAGAGDQAAFQAKRKSHLGKIQELSFVELENNRMLPIKQPTKQITKQGKQSQVK